MNEADPRCSQAQFLENNLWVMVFCTGFLVALIWGLTG